jgi:hypothetical protein
MSLKFIKPFGLFEHSQTIQEMTVFHNSPSPIKNIINRPIWASLELEEALGFYDNALMDVGQSFLYRIVIKGNFIYEAYAEEIFEENGLDYDDYVADLTSNPTMDEILNYEGTKLLLKNGYDGIIHSDYYVWDPQESVETILIFRPKDALISFDLIKDANALLDKYKKDKNI